MSVNFFDKRFQEKTLTDALFGLCDNQDNSKAYSDTLDKTKWVATVINQNNIQVTFTPIDNNIIVYQPGTKDKESTCDGMLTFSDSLYFTELKDQGKSWRTGAIEQLESTIKIFLSNHDPKMFKHKKAFVCNIRHPYFQEIDNELNKRFYNKYGFRIDVQAEIVIK